MPRRKGTDGLLLLSRLRDDAQLLHHAQAVHEDTALRELAFDDAIDHHALHRYSPTRGGDAKELTLVGAAPGEAADYLIPFGDLLLDVPPQVGESREERRQGLL